jgi:RNA polymerase sigma-70 factor, ECF subfamily
MIDITHVVQLTPPVPVVRIRKESSMAACFEKMVSEGCYRSFCTLFKKYYGGLCTYAQRYVGSREISEEVVADVFIKLWKNRDMIDVHTSYDAYLYRSVRNQALDYLKSRMHSVSEREQPIDDCTAAYSLPDESPEERLLSSELSEKIDAAVERLPKQCRIIYRLSRDERLKYHEIADRMGLSIKTIETQMGRAFKSLRRELGGYVKGK